MGTRADFYVGRGPEAKWRGSLAWDGHPDNPDYAPIFAAKTAREFDAAVLELARGREDWSSPDHGWPWPWNDSGTTDYAYAFDGGVWMSRFGRTWLPASPVSPEDWPEEPPAEFPDMSDVAAVTFGPRSGLTIIRVPTT